MKNGNSSLRLLLMAFFLFVAVLSGCASQAPVRPTAPRPVPQTRPPETSAPPQVPSPSAPAPEPAVPAPEERVEPQPPTPRTVASLRLTEEARLSLETGKPDQAIRTLERAMNLNPSNGQNFYYLSEAWLMKRNLRQAQEFNRLAAIYLKNDPGWMSRVAEQAERIRKVGSKQ